MITGTIELFDHYASPVSIVIILRLILPDCFKYSKKRVKSPEDSWT
jgi:hypothetical protein